VIVGLHCSAEHAHRFWHFRDNKQQRSRGHNGSLLANREFSAVTAACMLMRADVFNEVGGFDETLALGFNDIDLCLRTRARGYKVIQDANAVLYNHESQSRETSPGAPLPLDSARFIRRHRKTIFTCDPFYSPLLSKLSTACHFNQTVRASRKRLKALTGPVVLPIPDTAPRIVRVDGTDRRRGPMAGADPAPAEASPRAPSEKCRKST
jgi:GT2 family glycosyltransferase